MEMSLTKKINKKILGCEFESEDSSTLQPSSATTIHTKRPHVLFRESWQATLACNCESNPEMMWKILAKYGGRENV